MRLSEGTLRDYFKFLFLCYFYVLILRALEWYWVSRNHLVDGLARYETLGLGMDLLIVNALSIIYFLILISTGPSMRKGVNGSAKALVALAGLLHICFLNFYAMILRPVDQFLFKYSFREIFFTVTTSDANIPATIVLLCVFAAIAFVFPGRFNRLRVEARSAKWFGLVLLVSVPLSFCALRKTGADENAIRKNAVMNKSVFFYGNTLSSLLHRNEDMTLSRDHIQKFQSAFSGKTYVSDEYPLLHERNHADALGSYFNRADTLPNIVIIIVEGLGQRFLDTFHGIPLMPCLDSLAGQGLYWDRFFSTSERSFAVMTSVTGSLPYGPMGFNLLDPYPRHTTLMNLFKKSGYRSHFFYGQGAWFDQKDRFFKANGIDLVFDKSGFSPKYEKVMSANGKFFWGYQDMDLLQQSLEVLDTLPSGPRIDLYFTGSMHSPFAVGNPEYYSSQLDKLAMQYGVSGRDRRCLDKYRKYLVSALFFDHALERFMEGYAARDDFERTLFIITGDHPMTEIPIENSIGRYHVPLIVYSPLIKRPKRIHSAGSQLDIFPTLLSFMSNNYGLAIPEETASLGNVLDTLGEFRGICPVPFIDCNRAIVDYFEGGYYLSQGDRLYKVDPDFNLIPTRDLPRLKSMQENLDAFKRVNLYTCEKDRLIRDLGPDLSQFP